MRRYLPAPAAVLALVVMGGCGPSGPICEQGEVVCNDRCVYATFDDNNCGACGVVCGGYQSCILGACVTRNINSGGGRDSGTAADGGVPSDAGFPADGGPVPDGGFIADGGFIPDSGFTPDSGFHPDGGFHSDGGNGSDGGDLGDGGLSDGGVCEASGTFCIQASDCCSNSCTQFVCD